MEKLNKFPMNDFYCRSGSVPSAFGVLLCVFCFVMLGWTLSWISFKCFFFFSFLSGSNVQHFSLRLDRVYSKI
jgi:hypothetical protein